MTDTETNTSEGSENQSLPYACFGACGKTFESLDEMVPVPGADGRSPRHFCEDCAERVQRGPVLPDGGQVMAASCVTEPKYEHTEYNENLYEWTPRGWSDSTHYTCKFCPGRGAEPADVDHSPSCPTQRE